ncbi:MAG: FecR family protein [Proteobacteria bacterium]|nr:FecR family protein [Pseudomonadota bacterium]
MAADKGQSLRGQIMDWMLRLEAAPHDERLRADFDAWLARSERHCQAYRTMEHVWRRLGDLRSDDMDPARAETMARLVQLRGSRERRLLRPIAVLTAIALSACAALLYYYPALHVRLLADHLTSVAELRDITLEDGSVVQLDADSAISVKYTGERREVTLLSGQAFFDVAHNPDRPFAVIADGVTVTDTGTAFEVLTGAEGISVAVQSGSVGVSLDHGKHVAATLSRGERLTVSRPGNRVERGEIAPGDIASWRTHRLVVQDATLGAVVEELGRHYHGVIILKNEALARSVLTGVFDLRRPVEALNAVVQAQGGILTEITPYLMIISAR